jgi:UDP-glucose 4-epimerase
VWRTAMNQKRPYLDLQDAVRAVFHVIKKDLFDGHVYNVVTTNCTVADIVNSLKGHIPATKIQYVESPIMNQLTYTVDNAKFKGTGYVFTGSLAKGVLSTISLFKALRTGRA